MQGITYLLFSLLLPALPGLAREVPSNLVSLIQEIKAKGECSNKLATGFYSSDGGENSKSPACRWTAPCPGNSPPYESYGASC